MVISKNDCLSINQIVENLGISKTAFFKYVKHLKMETHKFPFDRKGYLTKEDVEALRKFVEEIKE